MLKQFIRKCLYPTTWCSQAYVDFLRKGGCKVGNGTHFYAPHLHPVDESCLPYVEIGSNCRITEGVKILAHDYSYAVLRPVYHHMLCKAGVTKIGNNVFIGMHSLIMMGVTIGNNVIIGSGSVVTRDVPDNCVVAGNPAKPICTLEKYYARNMEKFEQYARTAVERKREYLGRDPKPEEMGWFNCLWQGENAETIYRSMKVDGDDHEAIVQDMLKIQPRYHSYEEFLTLNNLAGSEIINGENEVSH